MQRLHKLRLYLHKHKLQEKMGCTGVIVTALIVIVLLKIVDKVKKLFKVPPVPFLPNTWWGPGKESEEDVSVKPFTIQIPEEVITDLHRRLENARPYTPPLEGIQHQYGLSTTLLNKIVQFWRTEYDWRQREAFLNKLPQFTVSVQGLQLHYIHVQPPKSDHHKVLPLLLLHGWPGSVREFYEIIPLLSTPTAGYGFVFEVVVPSLPGYGFSKAAVRPGLGAAEMAAVFKNFMNRLGFKKYYVQGGDWGAVIVQHMGTLFPEQVLGVHSNMCFVNTPKSNIKQFLYSFYPSLFMSRKQADLVYPLFEKFANRVLETGYLHLQATKPDTVGVALNDSPVGLAAYILEKFVTWTNPAWKGIDDGGLLNKYTYTDLLDNVMIYWVTNSITTSMRLYSETFNKAQTALGLNKIPMTVPTSVSRFIYDLAYQPSSLLKEKYQNIVHESDHEAGHFAAFEEPKILADDIFKGIEKMLMFHKTNQ